MEKPLRQSLLIILLLGPAGSGSIWAETKEVPLTQIPLLGNYVMNKPVAPHLGDAAEFAIRLLQWSDTNRPSILKVQRTIKGETYAQEWGANLSYNPLPLEGVVDLMSGAYQQLESPRLVKLEISDRIELRQAPERLDLLQSLGIPVPFVVRNSGAGEIRVTVRSGTEGVKVQEEPRTLNAGQSLGWFVPVSLEGWTGGAVLLKLDAGDLSREISLPTRAWDSGTLKVSVLDENGRPTQARVYLSGPDGKSYTPTGTQPRITNGDYRQPYGGEYYFYADGAFEVGVPAGTVSLEVVKGLEYEPVAQTVHVAKGRARELEFRLERTWDMGAKGWWSGDTHLHANLFHDPITGADDRIKPKDVLLVVKAEDLNVAHMLACNSEDGYVYERSGSMAAQCPLGGSLRPLLNEEMRNLRLIRTHGLSQDQELRGTGLRGLARHHPSPG